MQGSNRGDVPSILQEFIDLLTFPAVSNNFTVNTGEIVGITGVNGAGKTTLLRTLAGLSKQYSGSIMIADKNTTRERDEKDPEW